MNLYFVGAISLCVAILCACVAWVWQEIPILALVGLVFSSFTYGFILGENSNEE
jgi:uncharacterized membrane protein